MGVQMHIPVGPSIAVANARVRGFREEFSRLYELKDRISISQSSDAYFQDFEENLANFKDIKEVYLRWERLLEELDTTAWEHLKKKATPLLTKRNTKGRGWQQLFDILGEARGYRYLKSIGCTTVRFIPESKSLTPDLEGAIGLGFVLCEVKTINPSDQEIKARTGPLTARSVQFEITPEFLGKLHSTVKAAKQQMQVYDPSGTAFDHYVYLNVTFDDFFAECKEAYFRQIDCYLETAQVSGIRLIVCNDRTLFYKPLQMRSAEVDNND